MKKRLFAFLMIFVTITLVLTGCTENPASDFEYANDADEGMIITKYIGTDTDVVIPEKIHGRPVTQIQYEAFSGTDIVSVKMPDTVTYMGVAAFRGCSSLTTIDLSQSLTTIDTEAFNNCTKLSEIKLPDALVSICDRAFLNCTSLENINIPESVTQIGNNVFEGSGI